MRSLTLGYGPRAGPIGHLDGVQILPVVHSNPVLFQFQEMNLMNVKFMIFHGAVLDGPVSTDPWIVMIAGGLSGLKSVGVWPSTAPVLSRSPIRVTGRVRSDRVHHLIHLPVQDALVDVLTRLRIQLHHEPGLSLSQRIDDSTPCQIAVPRRIGCVQVKTSQIEHHEWKGKGLPFRVSFRPSANWAAAPSGPPRFTPLSHSMV